MNHHLNSSLEKSVNILRRLWAWWVGLFQIEIPGGGRHV